MQPSPKAGNVGSGAVVTNGEGYARLLREWLTDTQMQR